MQERTIRSSGRRQWEEGLKGLQEDTCDISESAWRSFAATVHLFWEIRSYWIEGSISIGAVTLIFRKMINISDSITGLTWFYEKECNSSGVQVKDWRLRGRFAIFSRKPYSFHLQRHAWLHIPYFTFSLSTWIVTNLVYPVILSKNMISWGEKSIYTYINIIMWVNMEGTKNSGAIWATGFTLDFGSFFY